jgi:AraC-like DNA-binding protein
MKSAIGSAHLTRTDLFGGFAVLQGTKFNTHLKPHVHAAYVLGVVDDGEVRITVGDQTWIAGAGAVIALPPYVVHTELATTSDGWSFTYLYPTEATVRTVLRLAPDVANPALRFLRPVIDDSKLAAAIKHAHALIVAGHSAAQSRAVLAELCRSARERHCTEREQRIHPGVRAARALITHGTPRSIALGDLAHAARMSTFHLTRVFHDTVGLPPYSYFGQVRIAQAHELIMRGASLSAVAYELGYTDQAHLTRHFQRASFATPGQFAALARAAYKPHRAA